MFESECEKPDSQMAKKQNKRRQNETPAVLLQQHQAAQEHKNFKARKFRKEQVLIETIGGQPISVDVWVSNEKPSVHRKMYEEIQDTFICEICKREFDERRKLLIHARCHRKKELINNTDQSQKTSSTQQSVITNLSQGPELIVEEQPNTQNNNDELTSEDCNINSDKAIDIKECKEDAIVAEIKDPEVKTTDEENNNMLFAQKEEIDSSKPQN